MNNASKQWILHTNWSWTSCAFSLKVLRNISHKRHRFTEQCFCLYIHFYEDAWEHVWLNHLTQGEKKKKNVLLQRYVLYHLGLLRDLLLNSTTTSIALLMTLLLLSLLLFVRTHIKKSQDWSFKCTSWTSTSKSLVINSANSKTGLKVWTRLFIAVPQKALLEIL